MASVLNHLPWVEKYRPKNISEVKGHSDIMTVLAKFRTIPRIPHLLFYGPPGTGKTSTILAMAKEYYGGNFKSMVMEVNASDERGVEIVTGKIKSFVQTRSFSGVRVKLVILDEADALTAEAQSALRRILEKSTVDVRFCICCNFINKISVPLQSRCTKFRFEGIDRDSLREMALSVCESEKIPMGAGAVDALLDLSKGDARRVINLLQSASLGAGGEVSAEYLYRLSGSPLPKDIDTVFCVLTKKSFKTSFVEISAMVKDKGYAVTDIVTSLIPQVMSRFESDPTRLGKLLEEFSDIEYNLAGGGSQKLAVGHLVSAFHLE